MHARLHGAATSLPSLASAGRRHRVTPGAIHKEALQRHSRPQSTSSRQSANVVTFQVLIFAIICAEDMAS